MHNHINEIGMYIVSREIQHPQVQTLRYEGSDLPRKRNPCNNHENGRAPLTEATDRSRVSLREGSVCSAAQPNLGGSQMERKVYPIDQHTEGRT